MSGLLKFLGPRKRPQSGEISAAVYWGLAATATAFYFIEPYDWLRKTFWEKPEPES